VVAGMTARSSASPTREHEGEHDATFDNVALLNSAAMKEIEQSKSCSQRVLFTPHNARVSNV
jgi:hypothetical protein